MISYGEISNFIKQEQKDKWREWQRIEDFGGENSKTHPIRGNLVTLCHIGRVCFILCILLSSKNVVFFKITHIHTYHIRIYWH